MLVSSPSQPQNSATVIFIRTSRFFRFFLWLSMFFAFLSVPAIQRTVLSQEAQKDEKKVEWKPLLVPELREKWNATNFGGEGKIEWKESEVQLEIGFPMTGLNFTGDFPKEGFEVEMEANRLEGSDFLCGLTFPVGKGFCSYIGGGWGGTLVGLSCVDYNDAANNSTTQFFNFENKTWYKFRVRVDAKNITCWIDDKEIVKQAREGHEFQVRSEVNASRPFGLAVYQSRVAIRNLKYRMLETAEAAGE